MLLKVKDVEKLLNIEEKTLYAWAAQGKIPSLRIHGLVRFDPDAIQEWLKLFVSTPAIQLRSITRHDTQDIDRLIEAAKREVYTPRHGETRPKSGLIQKEDADGPDKT